jgi:hypothetical protein
MSSTLIKRTGKVSGKAHRGSIGSEAFQRRQPQKTTYPGGFAHRTGFLKQRLKITPVKPDEYASFFKEHLTEENFGYLAQCAVHYAGLLEQTIEIPTGTVHEKIFVLYHRLAKILPVCHHLNFEIAPSPNSGEGRLSFLIYYVHPWCNYTFHWMPVGFINKLSGKFREIALSFMHLFIRRNQLARFSSQYEYEFMFEYLTENIANDGYEASERKVLLDLLSSYQTGDIAFLLDEVYDCEPLDVAAALKKYSQEERLLDSFRKGLPFISEDCIMNYDYNAFKEGFLDENEEYPSVTMDRTIRYVHALNDIISNEFESTVNQDLQGGAYIVEPTSFKFLHPASKLFCPDDYPERFSNWFFEMVNNTEDE